jgi:hypothetical protein
MPKMRSSRCKWLSIESAPKDGTTVLVWAGKEAHLAFYIPERGVWMQKDYEFVLTSPRGPPSHWMALPPPP